MTEAISYKHIIVGVDLSDDCPPVIRRAAAIAQACNAKLTLVHVFNAKHGRTA